MHRRDAMKLFAGATWTGLIGSHVLAQSKSPAAAFDEAKIETSKLRDGVHLLTGPGGNIAFLPGETGTLIVDCGVPGRTENIKTAIAAVSPAPVRLLVNTHWHFDHTGGNEALGKSGISIIAHENTRKRMGSDQFIDLMKAKMPASPAAALPTTTFKDSLTIHHGGEEIRIDHSPAAHTDTDVTVYFQKADVLHMGDLYFNGMYPFIDYSTGGTLAGMIAASLKVLKFAAASTKIIPGHGPVSGIAELRDYLDMLYMLRDSFKPLIDAGKTLPEIIAAKPTARLDPKYGKGFLSGDLLVEMVYRSMGGK